MRTVNRSPGRKAFAYTRLLIRSTIIFGMIIRFWIITNDTLTTNRRFPLPLDVAFLSRWFSYCSVVGVAICRRCGKNVSFSIHSTSLFLVIFQSALRSFAKLFSQWTVQGRSRSKPSSKTTFRARSNVLSHLRDQGIESLETRFALRERERGARGEGEREKGRERRWGTNGMRTVRKKKSGIGK